MEERETPMRDLNELSEEQLIAVALQHGLIGGCTYVDDQYVLRLDSGDVELERDIVPLFLRGMIRTYLHAMALQRSQAVT